MVGLPPTQWIVGSCDWWAFSSFFRCHWQSPFTALMAGKWLLLGLCRETVKEFKLPGTCDAFGTLRPEQIWPPQDISQTAIWLSTPPCNHTYYGYFCSHFESTGGTITCYYIGSRGRQKYVREIFVQWHFTRSLHCPQRFIHSSIYSFIHSFIHYLPESKLTYHQSESGTSRCLEGSMKQNT